MAFAEDGAISFVIPPSTFADVDGDALTLSARLSSSDPLPNWLEFNPATRVFTGTPPANFNGVLDIAVTANDGTLTVSDIFRLTIESVNDAPFVSFALADVNIAEDSAIALYYPLELLPM